MLGRPVGAACDAYLDAYAALPDRAEPLVEMARLERGRGRFEVAVLYARAAVSLPLPGRDALFVDRDAYLWKAHYELAVSCYWSGRLDEGRRAADHALAARPDDERLRTNRTFFDLPKGPDRTGRVSVADRPAGDGGAANPGADAPVNGANHP